MFRYIINYVRVKIIFKLSLRTTIFSKRLYLKSPVTLRNMKVCEKKALKLSFYFKIKSEDY